jgi:CRISPR/Cas system-associated exonuclease Cas4 (RecB family)
MQAGELSPYGRIAEIRYLGNTRLFPISWLHKQEFCEYQIFLENIKGIKVKPTQSMVEGKQEHERLYNDFRKEAVPATLEEMMVESKTVEVISREFRVFDTKHGIYGLIDEVLLTPDGFMVIDDKPGAKTFLSNIHQVHGYCLAFKEMVAVLDSREVIAALRQRGTKNIYWMEPFTKPAEESIVALIDHIHSLISGTNEFGSTDNPNKCHACRLRVKCNRALI